MRKDILVSVAIVDQEGPASAMPRLFELARLLTDSFAYFEIVYVLSEGAHEQVDRFAAKLSALPNLRIIVTSESTRFYQQRLIGVTESIGDVVALIDFGEVALESLPDFLSEAREHNRIMIGWRTAKALPSLIYGLLSLVSRHRVSAQAGRSIILSRDALGGILARRSAVLDLRFEPRMSPTRYTRFPVDAPTTRSGHVLHRYELFLEILLFSTPRLLKAYAAFGFLTACASILFAFYAIGVVLFKANVQEGWFTSVMAQAGSTAFVAGGMTTLSIALVAIYERVQGGHGEKIVNEISNTSFFDKATDLNVEFSAPSDLAASAEGQR